jgi:flagella synthesis protein FlgN
MAEVAAITEREIELISRFVALLKDEQDALKRADPSVLQDIGTEKTALAEQLNTLEAARRMALGIADDQNTRQAMSEWLIQHPEERGAAINWEKLLELSREAKQLHELNAGLVSMHLQLASDALTILTRQSEQHHALYGCDGQAAPVSGSRIVDSA